MVTSGFVISIPLNRPPADQCHFLRRLSTKQPSTYYIATFVQNPSHNNNTNHKREAVIYKYILFVANRVVRQNYSNTCCTCILRFGWSCGVAFCSRSVTSTFGTSYADMYFDWRHVHIPQFAQLLVAVLQVAPELSGFVAFSLRMRMSFVNQSLYLVVNPPFSGTQGHARVVQTLVRWRHRERGCSRPFRAPFQILTRSEIIILCLSIVLRFA